MKKIFGKSVLGLSLCLVNAQAQTAVEMNYKEALDEFKGENYSKSIKLLETAVGLNDKDPSLWLLLGKSYYQIGSIESAIQAFEKTLVLAPNEKYAKNMLAKLVKNTGTAEQRLKLIQELIDKDYYSLASAEAISISQLNLSHSQKGELLYKKAKISIGLNKEKNAILYIEKLKN